mgnify:CR=1 FL=1
MFALAALSTALGIMISAAGQAAEDQESDEEVNHALLDYPPIKNITPGLCTHTFEIIEN